MNELEYAGLPLGNAGPASFAGLDQSILDVLPLGVCACANDGRILLFNRKAAELWGRTPRVDAADERFCGSHALFALDGKPLARDRTPIALTLQGDAIEGAEAIVENPDGRRWIASATTSPVRDESGAVIGAISCFQDVSARHELERRRAEAEAHLEAVVETTPECIKLVAADGRLLMMNRAGLRMIGVENFSDVDGVNIVEFINPADRELWIDNHRRVVNGERLSWEFDIIGLNGERRHMETHATPFQLVNDEAVQLAVTRDVSARKFQALELAERERRQREVLEALPAAIYTTDAEGKITFYNEAAAALAGRRPILGADSWCVSWKLYTSEGAPLAHDQCPMALALRERRPHHGVFEALAERPNGERIPFLPFATPLFDVDGEMIGGVNLLVDMRERKRAEAAQRQLIDELNHRVKNTLATVQSIAMQTAKTSMTLKEFGGKFEGRLVALSSAHDVLTRTQWSAAPLRELVEREFAAFPAGCVELLGPEIELPPTKALSVSMILHELVTNASKHGSLSMPQGRVNVRWDVETSGSVDILVLEWVEMGGPPVDPPATAGFGSRLIGRAVERDLEGAVESEFARDGFRWRVRAPISPRVGENRGENG